MFTKNRSFIRVLASLLLLPGLTVAAPAPAGTQEFVDPPSSVRPTPAYPLWSDGPHPALKSVESRRAPDGSGTIVTLRGEEPISYSVASTEVDTWTLTLDGVDPRGVDSEVNVGTPELERISIRSVVAPNRRPAARIDFRGGSASDRRVTAEGNDLTVKLAKFQKPAAPAPVQGATPAQKSASGQPAAAPAQAMPPPPVAAVPAPKAAASAQVPVAPVQIAAAFSAPLAAASAGSPAAGPLHLEVAAGKSISLSLEEPVSRISVANPQIADAVVITPQQLLINGITPGNTSLVLWQKSGESKNYNLSVQMDTETLAHRLKEFFPQEQIGVGSSKETLVLYGTVSKPEIGDKAVKIATDYSGKIVNNLTYPPSGRRQIMLKVVFAEVDRQAVTELSASFSRVDPKNLRGDHEGLTSTGAPSGFGNFINDPPGPDFSFQNAINIYAFSFRDKISGFITAMQTKGLLQVLAEPTLIAADGQKASFLAGGEFPIPVVQAAQGTSSVTIIFKKFGISLDFTPAIRDDGTIVLQVEPEVSSLDFANAVVLSGFTVPALKVRRAATEVELKDGQSFAIAGLYSSDLQQTKKKIPLLGDIPLLGYLFRSKNLNKNKTELLVIATPVLVQPVGADQKIELPKFPMSFSVDKDKKEEKQEAQQPSAGDAGESPKP